MSPIQDGMCYRLVTDKSYIGHVWVKDWSHMGHRTSYRLVTHESRMGRGRITDESYMSHAAETLLLMGIRWIMGSVKDGLYMGLRWVTYESQTSLTLIILSNTTFLTLFSKLTNLWPLHNCATLRIRKMNVIFDQSEESNSVVSLTTLLWHVISWFSAHWVGEIIHFV